MISRKQFLATCLSLPVIGAAGFGCMRFWEPEWFEITQKKIPINTLKKSLRILHLADFHASDVVTYDYIESTIEASIAQKPDLAFLTGDFITRHLVEEHRYHQILSRLTSVVPTYACIGNHDGGSWAKSYHGYSTFERVEKLLKDSGLEFLFNQKVLADIAGESIEIIGLGDYWSGDTKPEHVMAKKREIDRPRLVLCHNPDAKELFRDYDWDLMFCGHTHGGQLVVPFLELRPFLPIRDKQFAEGLHPYDGRLIHVTRGIGNLHGLRFNCRPEISMIELQAPADLQDQSAKPNQDLAAAVAAPEV